MLFKIAPLQERHPRPEHKGKALIAARDIDSSVTVLKTNQHGNQLKKDFSQIMPSSSIAIDCAEQRQTHQRMPHFPGSVDGTRDYVDNRPQLRDAVMRSSHSASSLALASPLSDEELEFTVHAVCPSPEPSASPEPPLRLL